MNYDTKDEKTVNIGNQDKIVFVFVMLEIILYISFLLLDLLSIASTFSNILKYSSICICLLFVSNRFFVCKSKSAGIMMSILIFTVIADTFLIFCISFEFGVGAFIIVQILYSIKIRCMHQDDCKKYMFEVFGVAFLWNLFILVMKNLNLLTPIVVIASLYFTIFTGNMIRVWIGIVRDKKRSFYESSFAMGLLFFYLCDINVGLKNISMIESLIPYLNRLLAVNFGFIIWLFYLPSQVILSLHSVIYCDE